MASGIVVSRSDLAAQPICISAVDACASVFGLIFALRDQAYFNRHGLQSLCESSVLHRSDAFLESVWLG